MENDRMSKKWDERIDIFFYNTQEALEFGKRKMKIKFLRGSLKSPIH
jgi:3D (Asp-Asp-Asp) domain-containing protein